MKTFIMFTFLTVLNATASIYSQSESISLSVKDATVAEILSTIEQQSKYKFFYQNEQIDVNRTVSVNADYANIDELLEQVFDDEKVRVQILDDNLIVLTSTASQPRVVSGTITSSAGNESLPGVNIVEKGTTNGVISDMDGNYTISLQSEAPVLVFSFIGYVSQEIAVGTQTEIDIVLQEDFTELEEIVVIGYGTVKKTDLTGSVGIVDEEALTERSVNNPMEALQGNVAGVNIASSTGRLGDEYSITIRGNNSLEEGANPLYIIDGVANDGMDHLNPQDIARIDILKDASSTAIYGSRGSNGVIIVTTKSGATAATGIQVSFDSYYGIKKPARLPKLMDGAAWWAYHEAAYLGSDPEGATRGWLDSTVASINAEYPGPYGKNEALIRAAENNETFDWYDAVLKDGMMANNYLSISGKGENVSYFFGIGAQNETGHIANESLHKYSLKAGFDSEVSKYLSVGTNLTVTRSDQQRGNNQAMLNAFRFSPLMTPYDIDGETYFIQPGKLVDAEGKNLINKTSTWNPLLDIENASDLTHRYNVISSTYAKITAAQWLSFKSTFSVGYDNRNRGQSWGALTEEGNRKGNMPVGQISKTSRFNYTWDNQFNIDYAVNDHTFSLLGLQSIFMDEGQRTYQYANQMPFETSFYNLASGAQSSYLLYPAQPAEPASIDDPEDPDYDLLIPYYRKETLASFALRLNYNFKGKYLVTLSNRWDGSSVLATGNKWDYFPSGALAWRIGEEEFMQGQNAISRLKLRLSLGYTGNNNVPPYSSLNILDKPNYYSFGSSVEKGWLPSQLANPALTWEKTRELNLGLDFGFLNNRIHGTVDIYDRLSEEILMTEKLPLETGWDSYKANVGSVSNKGIELGLTTINISNTLLFWETSFIFSKNKNEIVSIHGQDETDDIGNGWFIGESINSFYNYEFDGIVQANEDGVFGLDEGMAKVKDQNGDGEISADDDRIILGSADPDWTGSFYTKLTIGGFDLSLSLITSQGVFVKSPFHWDFIETRQRGRQKLDIQVYVPENGAGLPTHFSNEYPRPRAEGTYWNDSDVGFYKDASFTKIKNIALGYSLPEQLLNKSFIKSLRIYFNVIDPFVWTEYEGYDPEWAAASINLGRVASITYQMGLNLKF